MSYISELQVDNGNVIPIGSSLYGICNTIALSSAKIITLNNFDNLVNGVTIHVKFTYGNVAILNNSFTLAVGQTSATKVLNPGGNMNWSAGAIISFTYDSTDDAWIVNDSDSSETSDTINISNIYNPNSTDAISGQGVANALSTLGEAANKDIISSIIETGTNINKNSDNLPTTAAVTTYIEEKTARLEDAMHYKGITSSELSDGFTARNIIINNNAITASPGDVVLSSNTHQEYIWIETNTTTHDGYWELLGAEGIYALNSSTANVIDAITFNGGSPTEVTLKTNTTSFLSGITNNNTARAAGAEVTHGVLKITTGILPTFSTAQLYEIDSITNGTSPTLSSHTKEVVIPYTL